jgi:photosystem II stability/assembly factor-like uncharacterized protein
MEKVNNILRNNKKCKFVFILFIFLFTNLFSSYAKWEAINSPTGGWINQIVTQTNKIYASAPGAGAFVSTDEGVSWNQITKGINNLRIITNLASDNNYLYAAAYQNGIYRTSDDGLNWEFIPNGLPESGKILNVNNIKIINSNIYLCTNDGLYKSSDFGNNWEEKSNDNLGTRNYQDIIELNDTNYVATNIGLFLFDKNLNSLDLVFKLGKNIYKVFKIETRLYACVEDLSNSTGIFHNIYEKVETDSTWSIYKDSLFQNSLILETKKLNSNLVISTLKFIDNNYIYQIYNSKDNGIIWTEIYNNSKKFSIDLTNSLTLTVKSILIGTRYNGILKMDYSGADGSFVNNNIFNVQISSLAFKNDGIYAGSLGNGIFYSNNEGNSWLQIQTSPKVNAEEFKSINKIVLNNQDIFAATSNGIYLSNDDGLTWNLPETNTVKPIDTTDIIDLIIEGSTIYAIGNSQNGNSLDGYFFISKDYGKNWSVKNLPGVVYCFLKDNADFYFGTSVGILKSSNEGNLLTIVGPDYSKDKRILSLVKSKNNILACSLFGLYLSKNNGSTWVEITKGLKTKIFHSLYTVGSYVFCASDDGVYFSIDHGDSWYEKQTGLNNFQILGFSNNKNFIYTYLYGDAIYKADISDFYNIEITSIPDTVLCSDMELNLYFKANKDIIFNENNYFIAQLSDSYGNFTDNVLNLDSVNNKSGNILTKIPKNLPFSNKYRIRIISTSPAVIGIDNSFDLTILNKTKPVITGDLNACVGDTVIYSLPVNPGFYFKWIVTNGKIIGDDNKNTVSVNWTNEGEWILKIIQINIGLCSDSNSIQVNVHPLPDKPVITLVDNSLISSSEIGNQWYLNSILLPNETGKILSPTANGSYSVNVTNQFGCVSQLSDQYFFENNDDFIVFEIDSASAYPGENLFINIRLIKNKKFYESNVNSLSAVFVCNSSLLYPLDGEKGFIIDGKRYLPITFDTTYLHENIVKVLKFEAMLGNAVNSEMSLEIIKINGTVETKTLLKNGLFSLLGVCYDGGARLVVSAGADKINSIAPNPAYEKIDVTFITTENNFANFYILNTLGSIESKLFNLILPAGNHKMTFSLKGLSSGDHYLIMETPYSKSLYKFVISR